MKPDTYFADPRRSTSDDIIKFNSLVNKETSILDVLGAVSTVTAILDRNRQIVYANESFMKLVGIDSLEPILGNRPGEAVSCVHSHEMVAGCGTSEGCTYCGAVGSILDCMQTEKKSVRDARLITRMDGQTTNWDLRVTTSPIKLQGINFYIFSVEDISDEKRRQSLERIFFHDILNSAGNINGLISLLKESSNPDEEKELIELSEESSRDLVEEIINHRQLRAAENGDLVVNPENIIPGVILKMSVDRISKNELSKGRKIVINDDSGGISLFTDKLLLQRILINMLKNAIEATDEGGIVRAYVSSVPDGIRFAVNNSHVMPDDIKLQVFQRSFSTKGTGRGIGTYSIRLLTESYLKGKAGFSSTEKEGTTFWIDLPFKVKS